MKCQWFLVPLFEAECQFLFVCVCVSERYSEANIPSSKPSVHINHVSLSLSDLPVFALSYKPAVNWHAVKSKPCRSVLHDLVRDA